MLARQRLSSIFTDEKTEAQRALWRLPQVRVGKRKLVVDLSASSSGVSRILCQLRSLDPWFHPVPRVYPCYARCFQQPVRCGLNPPLTRTARIEPPIISVQSLVSWVFELTMYPG